MTLAAWGIISYDPFPGAKENQIDKNQTDNLIKLVWKEIVELVRNNEFIFWWKNNWRYGEESVDSNLIVSLNSKTLLLSMKSDYPS